MRLNPAYNEVVNIPPELDQMTDEYELRTALRGVLADALDVKPDDTNLLVSAGILSFQQKMFDQAAYLFKRAIQQSP